MVPTKVPLWFAVQLVQRNLGKVQPPDWLHEDAVNDLWEREDRSREMQLLQDVIANPPTLCNSLPHPSLLPPLAGRGCLFSVPPKHFPPPYWAVRLHRQSWHAKARSFRPPSQHT